jgi:hypothetical protein
MGKAKTSAERYALFIRALGSEPRPYRQQQYDKYAAELQLQYLILKRSVGPEIAAGVRRSVRISLRPKSQLVATAPDSAGTTTPILKKVGKFKKARDRLRRFFAEYGETIPECRHCRMSCGFRKKSWPSKQWAEEALARSGDVTGFNLYECPKQPGYWHLGRKGKRQSAISASIEPE